MDKKFYAVTYHELRKILRKFNCDLSNPSKNTIDVIKFEEKKGIFGLGHAKSKEFRVAQIGFPGWTKQVGQGAIKTVRRETGLTPDNGYDSATFFKGHDPINCLIAEYQEPLMNLANK